MAFPFKRAPAALIALLLSACASIGQVDHRATTMNESVSAAQNRATLLNLVRASRSEPLYFMSLNQIGSSAFTDMKLGLPAVSFGPNLSAASKIYTFGASASNMLDNQTSTNFQMGVLSSRDFYSGLMSPVSLADVDLLLHQGFSRELVFYLVIDRIKITADGGEPAVIFNDPTDSRSFPLFEQYVREAMVHGLSTQSFLAPDDLAGPSTGGRPKLTPHAELCYERALATTEAKLDFPNAEGSCGHKPSVRAAGDAGGAELEVLLHGRRLKLEVTTRSVFGIFYYLGNVVAHHDEEGLRLRRYDLPAENTEEGPLLRLLDQPGAQMPGGASGSCFTALDYEGRHYCVPSDGAENTKRIFSILGALLALKQSPGDLPVTQTVRIAP